MTFLGPCPAIAPPGGTPPRGDRIAAKRREALKRYEIIDSEPEADFDNIALLAASVCETEFALISFMDDQRHWFKATHGLDLSEAPVDDCFCTYAIAANEIFLVEDARLSARFASSPMVVAGPMVRFYAGMRVEASDGTPIATLCVFDPAPRSRGLTDAQRLTLKVLALQVQSLIELRRLVIKQRRDVATQARLARRLKYLAEHDELTGLPLRMLFQSRLENALEHADRAGMRVAMLMIDVDHFKQVNDSLGHVMGDKMLRTFAQRVRRNVRKTDTVARIGGDEFGVVLAGLRSDEELNSIIRALNARLHLPFEHDGRIIDCRASIGLAVYPDHAGSAHELARCCDLALTEAKLKRGCAVSYFPKLGEEFQRGRQMIAVARAGIASNRMVPYYQPKVVLGTGALHGFEALVRCEREGAPPMLPEMFASAFEDRELSVAIGDRILESVLDNIVEWTRRGLQFGHVAVNLSAADFSGDDLAERLLERLDRRKLHPRVLVAEVTEGVFLGRGAHHVARALTSLKSRGVRIALDDFGTGYASLTHLKQFPVDSLKVDKSFVAELSKCADDTAIVRAVLGLGQSLGIETVAEGIETPEQLVFLRGHGCDIGQGYLFGHAQPACLVPDTIRRFAMREVA